MPKQRCCGGVITTSLFSQATATRSVSIFSAEKLHITDGAVSGYTLTQGKELHSMKWHSYLARHTVPSVIFRNV